MLLIPRKISNFGYAVCSAHFVTKYAVYLINLKNLSFMLKVFIETFKSLVRL